MNHHATIKTGTQRKPTPDIICFKDAEERWFNANDSLLSLYRLNQAEWRNKIEAEQAEFKAPIYREAFKNCHRFDKLTWDKGRISRSEEIIPDTHGQRHVFDVIKIPVFNQDLSHKEHADEPAI